MRVLIFGATGMLGHKLYQRLGGEFEVFGTIRSDFAPVEKFGIFDKRSIIEGVDVTDTGSICRALETAKPNCVINAVGVIKQLPQASDVIHACSINSIFPHQLAGFSTEFGFRLITISTDCVFDGKKGNYTEDDLPNARDVYGLTKLLGEVAGTDALTIRTSMIGRELGSKHSLVEWFLGCGGESVKGYVNAIYSGFPTIVLTQIIGDIINHHRELRGLYHVSSEPINKFDLLSLVNERYSADINIEPFPDCVIDRSLDSSKFRAATGFKPAAWDDMIEEMAADPTPYAAWHHK